MNENYRFIDGVSTGSISRIVVGKLKIGADLLDGIEELIRREHIKTGVFLSGVGALESGTFRNATTIPPDYKMNDNYRIFLNIKKPLELISLSGWIATTRSGETNIHCHFMATTVEDKKVISLGGHLVRGTIASIKVVLTIGVIEDTNIKAALDRRLDQIDLEFTD